VSSEAKSGDIVYQGVIRGVPVASAHKGRVGVNAAGKARYYPNKAWEQWFASAIDQTEKTLVRGGYRVERELHVNKTGPRKGLPGKNGHGQPTNVKNPLFVGDVYRVLVWYFYPKYMYKRDELGRVEMTKGTKKKEARPKLVPFKALDTDNVFKGTCDALQEGGVIDQDRRTLPVPIDMPVLGDDEEAFVCVQVKYMNYENPSDWVIPYPCPIARVDPRLFMPRIFNENHGHSWHVIKEEERNYRKMLGTANELPVTKAVCRHCTALIGQGHSQTEIWWHRNPARWGNETVLICGTCGKEQFYKVPGIQEQIDQRTLQVAAKNNLGITEVPCHDCPDWPVFDNVRRRVEEALLAQYREKYCIVCSTEIGSTSWATIANRWSSVNGEKNHVSSGNSAAEPDYTGCDSDSRNDSSQPAEGRRRPTRAMAPAWVLAARDQRNGEAGPIGSSD
jgi:hypothetical protein